MQQYIKFVDGVRPNHGRHDVCVRLSQTVTRSIGLGSKCLAAKIAVGRLNESGKPEPALTDRPVQFFPQSAVQRCAGAFQRNVEKDDPMCSTHGAGAISEPDKSKTACRKVQDRNATGDLRYNDSDIGAQTT